MIEVLYNHRGHGGTWSFLPQTHSPSQSLLVSSVAKSPSLKVIIIALTLERSNSPNLKVARSQSLTLQPTNAHTSLPQNPKTPPHPTTPTFPAPPRAINGMTSDDTYKHHAPELPLGAPWWDSLCCYAIDNGGIPPRSSSCNHRGRFWQG